MGNKLKRYFTYIGEFIKSSDKEAAINAIKAEIKNKGLIEGLQSYLHKASGIDSEYNEPDKLSIKEFDRKGKVVLPLVSNPKVSIIIPMYNQLNFTADCINSIYENCGFASYEIIIADDNSTEDSGALTEWFENIVIHRNETNQGFLMNCNLVAEKAKGEYIALLNNDTQVQKNWLEELLAIFENFEGVGIAGSKLLYPNRMLQEAGGIIWKDGSGWNYGNGDKPGKPEYCYVKEADYISGASFLIPRVLWKEVGGFDPRYIPAYCEDSDLCFQVRSKGYKVMYQPFSKVVHFEGISHGKELDTGIKKYQVINQEKFYNKWNSELSLKSANGENVFTERDRSGHKKHVLVIDHYLPEVDKDAGSRTISNYVDVMLDLGYCVKFLGEAENEKRYRKPLQEKGVEVLYGSMYDIQNRNWESYFKSNINNFDAVLLSRSSVCTPVITFLKKNEYKGNIIYYGHDLGFLRLEKEAAIKNNAELSKLAKELKAKEDYMYMNADNALICSLDELVHLRQYITRPLHYIPPYFFDVAKDILPYESRSGILFVGGFRHTPNQDAMRWFIEEVYELLDKQGIRLTIAGSEIPEFILDYKKRFESLTVLPDVSVEDLGGLYAATRIAVVPLTVGAGVKGKVIEAMSKGVPVVGTDIAFEGMPKDESYLYKGCNTAGSMVENILRVYSSKKEWESLSEFGKMYVSNNFSKENMKQVFSKLIG